MSTVNVTVTPIEKPTVWSGALNADGTQSYSVAEILITGAATPVAGGAGQTVTVTFDIAFDDANLEFPETLPAIYNVQATPSQPCATSFVKTSQTAFNVLLTPLDVGTTLSAGTVDVRVSFSRG